MILWRSLWFLFYCSHPRNSCCLDNKGQSSYANRKTANFLVHKRKLLVNSFFSLFVSPSLPPFLSFSPTLPSQFTMNLTEKRDWFVSSEFSPKLEKLIYKGVGSETMAWAEEEISGPCWGRKTMKYLRCCACGKIEERTLDQDTSSFLHA